MRNVIKNPKSGYMIACVAFGTIGLLTRLIPLSSGELALYRGVVALLVLSVIKLFTKGRLNIRSLGHDALPLFLSGVAIGFNWILLFTAYRYTTVSLATLSYYFAPVIVMVASPLLFHETLTKKQILCFIVSTLGLVLITGVGAGGVNDCIGILFGLGAAALYAFVVLMNKRIQSVSGLDRTMLQFLAAILVLVPYTACTSGFHLASAGTVGLISLLILGVVHTGLVYWLYFATLKKLPGQEAAILSYIDPLVAVLCSVFVLGEPLTLLEGIGGAILLAGTLFNEIPTRRA